MNRREINYMVRQVVDMSSIGKVLPKGSLAPVTTLDGNWVIIRNENSSMLAVTIDGEVTIVSAKICTPRGLEPGASIPVSVTGSRIARTNKMMIAVHLREMVGTRNTDLLSKKLVRR